MQPLDTDPFWLRFAIADIGLSERNNDAPWLRSMLAKLGATWLVGQPWCGSILATWFKQAGIAPPKAYYRAKAWLDWGKPIDVPVRGCVAVFEREGGGHVGLVVGTSFSGRLSVLAGNQGDSVCVSAFPTDRVLGYRLPPGDRIYIALPHVDAAGSPSGA